MQVYTADASAWLTAWERTGREPFAHPAYVSLFARSGDTPLALYWEGQGGEVLLPLVLRSLPDEKWVTAAGEPKWRDAVSPYGYGGPFFAGKPDWQAFYSALLVWMRQQHVLTAFIRASLENPPPTLDLEGYEASELSENVVVDLRRSPEEQWDHYEHKVRKNVKKAQRAQLRAEIHSDFRHLNGFLDIYHGTMQRRDASDWYYFEEPFFQAFDEQLRGNFIVAEIFDAERLISAELVLESDQYLYSYLGGTHQEAFVHAPNDLLKHAVIEYGHQQGKLGYVLGGGYSTGDGIFKYKKAFDKDGVVPFYGIRLTADPHAYEVLSAAKREESPGSQYPSHYFPAYRAPALPPEACPDSE